MGEGTRLARQADIQMGGTGATADLMDTFKEQVLVACLKRLRDGAGNVTIPVSEIDGTGDVMVMLSVRDGVFHFEVKRKQ